MKLRIVLICLLLVGCGQDNKSAPPIDISMTEIVWQGYADKDAVLLQKYDETMACLAGLNAFRSGYPYVIILKSQFNCTPWTDNYGCFDGAQTIYFAQNFYDGFYAHDVFKHELIHWATRFGISAHGSIYFTQCDPPLTSTP